MSNVIGRESTLKQKYIRDGLDAAAAFEKARAVLELIEELRVRCPELTEAQLLRDAEQDALASEEAIRDYVDRVERPAKLTIAPLDDGLHLQRGDVDMLLTGHELDALLAHIRARLAANRKSEKRGRIHTRRLAEGRDAFRVVGGRLMNEQAA
jgi:hypothetical protein